MEVTYRLYRLLERLYHWRGSELRLQTGERPLIYVGDNFREAWPRSLSADDLHDLICSITPPSNWNELERQGETHFPFDFGPGARYAAIVRTCDRGLLIVIRPG